MGQAKRRLDNSRRESEKAVASLIPSEALKGADGVLTLIDLLHHAMVKIPVMFEEAYNRVNEMDKEYGDLTHAIELGEFPRKDAHGIMMRLKNNRKERREFKDFVSMAQPLKDYVLRNPQVIKEIEGLHTAMHRLKSSLETRVYTVRSLGSMEEAFAKAGIRTMATLASEVKVMAEASDGAEGMTELTAADE